VPNMAAMRSVYLARYAGCSFAVDWSWATLAMPSCARCSCRCR
jgi:hypothetical protein